MPFLQTPRGRNQDPSVLPTDRASDTMSSWASVSCLSLRSCIKDEKHRVCVEEGGGHGALFSFCRNSLPLLWLAGARISRVSRSEAKGSVLLGPRVGKGRHLAHRTFYVLSMVHTPPERSPSRGCENTPGVVGLLVIVQASADVISLIHAATPGLGRNITLFLKEAQKDHERRWELPLAWGTRWVGWHREVPAKVRASWVAN